VLLGDEHDETLRTKIIAELAAVKEWPKDDLFARYGRDR